MHGLLPILFMIRVTYSLSEFRFRLLKFLFLVHKTSFTYVGKLLVIPELLLTCCVITLMFILGSIILWRD